MSGRVIIPILLAYLLIAFLGCPVINESSIPAAPDTLSVISISSTQIDLTWTDNSSNEDGFKIERSPDGSTFTQIDTVSTGVTSYSDTGLSAGTVYYYQVQAYNAAGDSGYSNMISATTNINTGIDLIITVNKPGDETISFNASDDIIMGPTDTLTVTITESFDSYEWYFYGMDLSSYDNLNTVSIDCSALEPGVHYLTVFVGKNGNLYSKTLRFRVEN